MKGTTLISLLVLFPMNIVIRGCFMHTLLVSLFWVQLLMTWWLLHSIYHTCIGPKVNSYVIISLLFIAQDQRCHLAIGISTQDLVGLRMLSATVVVFWLIMSFVTMYVDNIGKRWVIIEYFIFNHKVVMVMLRLCCFSHTSCTS